MNKKVFASLFFMFTALVAFAHLSVDPQDEFYTHAQSWELKGYVEKLPQLRPYPLNVIKNILSQVIEKGSGRDCEIAKEYYERVTGRPWHIVIAGGVRNEIEYDNYSGKTVTRQYNGGPRVIGDLMISPIVSVGYDLGIYSVNEDDVDVMPVFSRSENDTVADSTEIGPFRLNIDMNSNVAVGTERVYVQAGINRSGFGPFLNDDLALSDNAFHAPSFAFYYDGGAWSYSHIIQSVGASLNNGEDLMASSQVNKFFALHSIRVNPLKTLSISYYESTVFGKRFDIAYMVPAPFMAIQGIGDSNDNSQMGLLIEYSPVRGLKWSSNFFADDLPLNDIMKLKFDTKIRVGIESGIQYSPTDTALELMNLNYTIVAPYTYAHWSYDEDGKSFTDTSYNYFNYMNRGIAIGISLPPNSDRIGFSAKFRPAKNFNVTVRSNFMRHANAYESLDSEEAEKIYLANYYSHRDGVFYVKKSDGTPITQAAYDAPGFPDKNDYIRIDTERGDVYSTNSSAFSQQKLIGDDVHVDTAWDHLNLLNQGHVMTVIQAGLDMSYTLSRMKSGVFTFNFGWTWEYIINNGVQNAIYSGSSGGGNYRTAKAAWENQLYDSINNYLSFSVKLVY
ncbi:hypothetical protein HRI96_05455 [Treponema parvum]|uniref:Uncharacterized protein n=1 Tax=Treponema parvum TaxID=138851 RepID=A0A975F095_9SPIR|nr:hypothetical protein [Treponema parvum]QTQ11694.1 hypothetical protein HRI96_05455 [Treponema parvum]